MDSKTIVLGAVAYDPKVVTIWEGFKAWFASRDFSFDYVLYSNYERQVEAHFAGEFDVAWNSPLAWIEAERLAAARGRVAHAIAMRDTDRDLDLGDRRARRLAARERRRPARQAGRRRRARLAAGDADPARSTSPSADSSADRDFDGRAPRPARRQARRPHRRRARRGAGACSPARSTPRA